MPLKIIHISLQNDAGIPLEYVRAHRARGHDSLLFSHAANPYLPSSDDEIILHTPARSIPLYSWYQERGERKRLKRHLSRNRQAPSTIPLVYRKGVAGRLYGILRDAWMHPRIQRLIHQYNLTACDVLHCDNGMGFFADSRFVKHLKARGTRVVCCWHGTDLRNRGVLPDIDSLTDANITSEHDLLSFHPTIHHIFYPFNTTGYPPCALNTLTASAPLRIAHAPTNRVMKGTDHILSVLENLSQSFPIDIVCIERMPRSQALKLKATCHLCIDQIGNVGGTGYGVTSLESFAMEQPVITDFSPEYDKFLAPHPFLTATPETLEKRLVSILSNRNLLREQGRASREWLDKTHAYGAVHEHLARFYRQWGLRY